MRNGHKSTPRTRRKHKLEPSPAERTRAEMRKGLKAERDVRSLSKQIGRALSARDEALEHLFATIAVRLGRDKSLLRITQLFGESSNGEAHV